MAQPQEVTGATGGIVGPVADAVRAGMDAGLRYGGGVMAPTLWIFAEDMDQPLLAKVTVRPFYAGADAVAAVAGMGELASVLAATRLLITYEAQDFAGAMGAEPDPEATALVVLDATPWVTTVYWQPLTMRPAPDWRRTGAVIPEWGATTVLADRPVPAPIRQLLHAWQELRGFGTDIADDLNETAIRLQAAGYVIAWVER